MTNIIDFLKGKKTYILSGIALITISLYLAGYVDETTANTILAFAGFGGLITLRAAIK